MTYKHIIFSGVLGGLYGFIVGYNLPMPYSVILLIPGAMALGWYGLDIYRFIFRGE